MVRAAPTAALAAAQPVARAAPTATLATAQPVARAAPTAALAAAKPLARAAPTATPATAQPRTAASAALPVAPRCRVRSPTPFVELAAAVLAERQRHASYLGLLSSELVQHYFVDTYLSLVAETRQRPHGMIRVARELPPHGQMPIELSSLYRQFVAFYNGELRPHFLASRPMQGDNPALSLLIATGISLHSLQDFAVAHHVNGTLQRNAAGEVFMTTVYIENYDCLSFDTEAKKYEHLLRALLGVGALPVNAVHLSHFSAGGSRIFSAAIDWLAPAHVWSLELPFSYAAPVPARSVRFLRDGLSAIQAAAAWRREPLVVFDTMRQHSRSLPMMAHAARACFDAAPSLRCVVAAVTYPAVRWVNHEEAVNTRLTWYCPALAVLWRRPVAPRRRLGDAPLVAHQVVSFGPVPVWEGVDTYGSGVSVEDIRRANLAPGRPVDAEGRPTSLPFDEARALLKLPAYDYPYQRVAMPWDCSITIPAADMLGGRVDAAVAATVPDFSFELTDYHRECSIEAPSQGFWSRSASPDAE